MKRIEAAKILKTLLTQFEISRDDANEKLLMSRLAPLSTDERRELRALYKQSRKECEALQMAIKDLEDSN